MQHLDEHENIESSDLNALMDAELTSHGRMKSWTYRRRPSGPERTSRFQRFRRSTSN
jgi:hypothetical protein